MNCRQCFACVLKAPLVRLQLSVVRLWYFLTGYGVIQFLSDVDSITRGLIAGT